MNMKKVPQIVYYLAAAALLGGYIYFFERGAVKTDTDKDKKPKVFDGYVADDIKKIVLENLSTTVTAFKAPVVLEKDAKDVWQITAPKNFRADEETIHGIINNFSNFNPDTTIENPANLADFGFNTPTARCSLTDKAGKSFVLLIGDKSINGSSDYVKVPAQKDVYLVPGYMVDNLSKDLNTYRDKKLFKTDDILSSKVRVVYGGKTTVFEKNKEGGWDITEPLKTAAEGQRIKDIFNAVSNLKISDFADDNPSSLAPYGLSKPRASIEIWPAEGNENHLIQVGNKQKKTNEYYAKMGDQPNVFLINEGFYNTLNINPDSYRDKSMMKFDARMIKSLTVTHAGRTYAYQKDAKDQWACAGRAKAADEASYIVSTISSTSINGWAKKKDITGLDHPDYVIEAVLSSGVKKVYRFGNHQNADVFLTVDDKKDVYLAPSNILSQMEVYYSTIMTPVPVSSPAPK